MVINLPWEPKYSRQWIETLLSRTHFKKPYDRFMWWRSYTPKNKPLPHKASFRDKLVNGDYECGPYLLEVELCKHTMNDKFKECITANGEPDWGKYNGETSIDRARMKRLREDYDKEETRKLEDLRSLFAKEFNMTKDDYEKEITKGSDTLVQFYDKMEKKYGKRITRKSFR